MRLTFLPCAAACLAAVSMESQAEAQYDPGTLEISAELGYARLAERDGAELGIGGRYAWSGLRLTGLVGGFIYANEDDRFRSETFGNGNTVCRDTSNGQFTNDTNCAADVAAYGKLEAAWAFDGGLELGIGGRFSEDQSSAFGTIAYKFNPSGAAVYASVGDDYVGVGIGFRP